MWVHKRLWYTAGGTTTTLGRIGTGYIYADWNGQIAYTTPNMNGFQLTAGVMQPWNAHDQLAASSADMTQQTSSGTTDEFGFQGQASYSWTGDFAGKALGWFLLTRSNRYHKRCWWYNSDVQLLLKRVFQHLSTTST